MACPTARRTSARRAVTLLELATVVLIVGLLGMMAATRYGGSAIAEVDAQGFARRLALDCLQARRRAISTGQNHSLSFIFAGSPNVGEYAVYRDPSGSNVRVDEVRVVPGHLRVMTGGASKVEFTFTGEAIGSYTITVEGPDRTWAVSLPQVTGKAFIDEL